MKTPLLFLAAAMVVAACGSRQESGDEIEIILPGEDQNDTAFYKAIKSIEVIDLEVDSNHFYIDDADLRVSPNYYYFVNNRNPYLACYDKATGKVQFSRTIAGRSRAECNVIYSSFVMGDTIVLNDIGVLKMYDHTGKFLGTLNDTAIWTKYLLPLGDGYIACDFGGSPYSRNRSKCLTLFDKNFNAGESFFKLPKLYKAFAHYHISNSSPNVYMFNDTLRFCAQNTFKLHSFPDGKTYHFITSNPIPESLIKNPDDINFSLSLRDKGYAMEFQGLVENQDYIMFKYVMDMRRYGVLYSKRDNKVYGLGGYFEYNTSADMWKSIVGGSDFLYSDGKYFYARAFHNAYGIFEKYNDLLDDRQRAIYDTMQARLARSDEKDFRFYYKFEF